jgi:LPPG:FO 2-phospho-L-lactate transferase
VAGVQGAIEKTKAPRVAVSPIVGGTAVKGPAGDMLRSLGHEVSPVGVAALYAGLLDGIVIDKTDEQLVPRIKELGMEVHVADTIMNTNEDRARLAEEVLQFCLHLC